MALRSGLVALLAAQSVLSSPHHVKRQNPAGLNFNWGGETIRGVNIGGWLVLEPYVTRLISTFNNQQANKTQMDNSLDIRISRPKPRNRR